MDMMDKCLALVSIAQKLCAEAIRDRDRLLSENKALTEKLDQLARSMAWSGRLAEASRMVGQGPSAAALSAIRDTSFAALDNVGMGYVRNERQH